MLCRRICCSLILYAGWSLHQTTQAVELAVLDADLGLELRPQDFDFVITDANILSTAGTGLSARGSDSYEYGFGLRARALLAHPSPGSNWGPIYGVEATAGWSSYESGGHYSTFALRGLAGLGWQVHHDWMLHATSFAGIGHGSFTFDSATLNRSVEVTGWPVNYGLRCGAAWSLNKRWHLHADVGYTFSDGSLDGDGFTLDIEEQGLTAFLGMSWRFNTTPRLLD